MYKWYDADSQLLGEAPYVPQTTLAGTTAYVLRAALGNCVSAVDTAIVVVDPAECNYDITIHNAITPNGDGKNDRWVIDNLGYYPNMTVQLFDKQGDKVFEKTNYLNDWDGGNLPSGTYYYLIRLNGQNRTTGTERFTGYLLIKR
jgi:gliding motility-associated-like protein